jgi:hypothetical protein
MLCEPCAWIIATQIRVRGRVNVWESPITKTLQENEQIGGGPLGRSSLVGEVPGDVADDLMPEGWSSLRDIAPGIAQHEWEAVLAQQESRDGI